MNDAAARRPAAAQPQPQMQPQMQPQRQPQLMPMGGAPAAANSADVLGAFFASPTPAPAKRPAGPQNPLDLFGMPAAPGGVGAAAPRPAAGAPAQQPAPAKRPGQMADPFDFLTGK